MKFAIGLAGMAAASMSPVEAQTAPLQPTQAELEAALLALHLLAASHPDACRMAGGCYKPPRAIRVRDFDCQATGTDAKLGPILYCRVTYVQRGGELDKAKSANECVPLRATDEETVLENGSRRVWEVAQVDREGKCPGARH